MVRLHGIARPGREKPDPRRPVKLGREFQLSVPCSLRRQCRLLDSCKRRRIAGARPSADSPFVPSRSCATLVRILTDMVDGEGYFVAAVLVGREFTVRPQHLELRAQALERQLGPSDKAVMRPSRVARGAGANFGYPEGSRSALIIRCSMEARGRNAEWLVRLLHSVSIKATARSPPFLRTSTNRTPLTHALSVGSVCDPARIVSHVTVSANRPSVPLIVF